jgi:hypothetical protein
MQDKPKPIRRVRKKGAPEKKKAGWWTKAQRWFKRGLKATARANRNTLPRLLCWAALACVETFTALGIIQETPAKESLFGVEIPLAAIKIGISLLMGLIAVEATLVAAELATDPREEYRKRSAAAARCAFFALLIPVYFFACALALNAQRANREEYIASEVYPIDQALAEGRCLDESDPNCYVTEQQQADAIVSLARANEVRTARMDETFVMSFLFSAFVYWVIGSTPAALHRPRPETPREAEHRIDEARKAENRAKAAAKAEATAKAQREAESLNLVETLLSRLGFFNRAETRFVSPDAPR